MMISGYIGNLGYTISNANDWIWGEYIHRWGV